jgi:hypothetical protein
MALAPPRTRTREQRHRSVTTSPYQALRGRSVRFRIRDVHLPAPAVILEELYGAEVLEGEVVDLSDSGTEGGAFVVVQVTGFQQPLILAVERILRTI